jgi:hypothetical protein
LKWPGLHELLLHDVLDLLDPDEGLVRGLDPLRDGLGDRHGRRRVARERQEGLAHGDLHLVVVPRHDLAVAADDADGALGGRLAADRELARAVEQEALRHHVGVVVDQGLLDQLVEAVERQPQRILLAGELGQVAGELAADLGDPGAVLLREDLLLALRDADIRERLAERVGDLGHVEALLAVRAQQDDRRQR